MTSSVRNWKRLEILEFVTHHAYLEKLQRFKGRLQIMAFDGLQELVYLKYQICAVKVNETKFLDTLLKFLGPRKFVV